MQELCVELRAKGLNYDLIGHTSNTLYAPDYRAECIVSTRKLTCFEIKKNEIICECGTSVRKLAKAAVEAGVKGYEGLVDLPGTVAAAVYGNAGCYGCSISRLLIEAQVLTEKGELQTVKPDWFAFASRSSALKRGEKSGTILTLKLKAEHGDQTELAHRAAQNHYTRKLTQPAPQGTLGSIFANDGKPTLLNRIITTITKIYEVLLNIVGSKETKQKRKHLTFLLLNATDVEPYVHHWNCYWWRDEKAHELFWKYVRLHRRMFTRSVFEIEIKHNSKLKIP